MDILQCTPEEWIEKETEFLNRLEDESVWNSVPLLNSNELHNFQDLKLVRFRGMIQDMHGPEFYLEKFETINEHTKERLIKFGKYSDFVESKENETVILESPSTVRNERQSYVVISVPAVNQWVKTIEEEKFKLTLNQQISSSAAGQIKRSLDEEMDVETGDVQPSTSSGKKLCTTVSNPQLPNTISKDFILNFPIPDDTGRVCHLKVYRNSDQLALNHVCDFVGFLSVDPSLAYHSSEEGVDDVEFITHNPPPSLVPRIHCVTFKTLSHCNPLVDNGIVVTEERFRYVKGELMIVLTQLLFGDELAAEFLIYHLISEVYLRKDLLALGKFSLNISNVPVVENLNYGRELYKFIELLTTKSHYVAMSLENMNELEFIPKKNYDSNRLTSSILQLSANTHLVVDETKLNPGKLNEAGVKGVNAINRVITNQKALYDFTYYQIEFDTDIPFLVLSEGKSLLPSDCHVSLKVDELHLNTFKEITEAAGHFLKPDLLTEIRRYLTLARMTKYEIQENVQQLVEKEFVNMRQKGNVSATDLHNLLVLARLVCISEGKSTLDPECWKKACTLEEARKGRISSTN